MEAAYFDVNRRPSCLAKIRVYSQGVVGKVLIIRIVKGGNTRLGKTKPAFDTTGTFACLDMVLIKLVSIIHKRLCMSLFEANETTRFCVYKLF